MAPKPCRCSGLCGQYSVTKLLPRSVQLKLDRAAHHLEALNSGIQEFFASNPYEARRDVEHGGTHHVIRWVRYTDPPPTLGLIAGEAIHNMRSSLDHMVVVLAKAGAIAAGVELTKAEERGLQFPITDHPQEFRKQVGRRLKHVTTMARDFIEGRQPYQVHFSAEYPLRVVSELDNADKHRALTTAGLSTGVHTVNWPTGIADTPMLRPQRYEPPAPDAEVGRFVFPEPHGESELPIEFSWGLTQLLGDGAATGITAALDGGQRRMRRTVEHVQEDVRAEVLVFHSDDCLGQLRREGQLCRLPVVGAHDRCHPRRRTVHAGKCQLISEPREDQSHNEQHNEQRRSQNTPPPPRRLSTPRHPSKVFRAVGAHGGMLASNGK